MFWLPTVFFAGWLPNTAIFALQSRSILVLACNKGQRNGPTKKKLTSSYDRRSQNEIDWNRINTLNIWISLKHSCLRLGHKKTPLDTNLFKHPVAAPRVKPDHGWTGWPHRFWQATGQESSAKNIQSYLPNTGRQHPQKCIYIYMLSAPTRAYLF